MDFLNDYRTCGVEGIRSALERILDRIGSNWNLKKGHIGLVGRMEWNAGKEGSVRLSVASIVQYNYQIIYNHSKIISLHFTILYKLSIHTHTRMP